MADETVSISVAASEYAVMAALVKVVGDAKKVVKAGGGTVAEVSALGAAFVADLMPALSQLGSLSADAAADPVAAETAVLAQVPALVAAIRS